jgi:Ser/Thr protein kinase RdoA (MazF antagonist)
MPPGDWHASPPPEVPPDTLSSLLAEGWGLSGSLQRLYGERDLNHHVTTPSGERFLFKVSHPDTGPRRLHLENRLLTGLGTTTRALPRTPNLVRTLSGAGMLPCPGAGPARVLTWLSGTPLDAGKADRTRLTRLGKAAARLNHALGDLPVTGHAGALPDDLPWDLRNLPALAPLVGELPEPIHREAVLRVIEHFRSTVVPTLERLPAQLVHNDLNPDNLLYDDADPSPFGIIDFGDMVRAPVVCDLAILLTYLVNPGDDPLSQVNPVLRAFHRELPLASEAAALLPALLQGRLCQTLLIQGARLGTDRRGASGLSGTVREAWARFAALHRFGPGRVRRSLSAACQAGSLP